MKKLLRCLMVSVMLLVTMTLMYQANKGRRIGGSYGASRHCQIPLFQRPGNILIAINLWNNQNILGDYLNELLTLAHAMKPVFVSIYENGTNLLNRHRIPNRIVTDPALRNESEHRIQRLAKVRNHALQVLDQQSDFRKVIFLNDVTFCANDVLRLLDVSDRNDADLTCGLDFYLEKGEAHFYDSWVSRDLEGNDFLQKVPFNMFQNVSEQALARNGSVFPVYCCWNGGVVMNSKPLIKEKIRFRAAHPTECDESECSLLCKDFWRQGYNRIVLDPTVHFAYDAETFKLLKMKHKLNRMDNVIQNWGSGPNEVRCTPLSDTQKGLWMRWVDSGPGSADFWY